MNPRVLVLCKRLSDRLGDFTEEFDRLGLSVDAPHVSGQQLLEADLLPIIGEYDGVIAGDDQFTAAVLDAAERLVVISKWGIGLDGIDLEHARSKGVAVFNTPGQLGEEVADLAFGYLIMLTRGLHLIDQQVRAGNWFQPEGRSLSGMTAGVIGLGASGNAFARRCLTSGMSVVGWDASPQARDAARVLGVHLPDTADDVLPGVDALSLHVPLLPSTRHLLNAERLAKLRPGALVINTSRGEVVDERALVAGLVSGQLGGAALDVFEQEPLDAGAAILAAPNCILGSHNASNTRDAAERVNRLAVDNLLIGLRASGRL